MPPGVVMASAWLSKHGYSPELIRNYKESQWLEELAYGAVIRYNDQVDYLGAIYTLQNQYELSVHPAAVTALGLLGRAHYLELNQQYAYLFGYKNEVLPSWMKQMDWGISTTYVTSSFLPLDLGMTQISHKNFSLKVSSTVRAMMECLYLAPQRMELMECFELMQGLTDLIPHKVEELLERCTSIKVKRLFLYLAEKSNHSWFKYLKLDHIDLGTGTRSLVKGGIYIPKYQITVPKEIEKK